MEENDPLTNQKPPFPTERILFHRNP